MRAQRSRRGVWPSLTLALAAVAVSCAATTPEVHLGWGPPQYEAEQRCQQGTIAACGELGRFLVGRSEVDKDVERGLVLLEVACGQGDAPSCATLGRHYIDRRHAPARARARELLGRACDRSIGEGCTGLGEAMQLDGADATDFVAPLEKGCALGDASGCERAGMARWRDSFGNGHARAEELFGRGCALGALSSCHYHAMAVVQGPATWSRGIDLLRANCDRGYVKSCWMAATAFAPLLGAHPDCAVAAPLADKACHGRDGDACAIADACALAGPARADAIERLRLACERAVATSCLYWADAQPEGAEREHVEKAYEIACQHDSAAADVACPRLAVIALGRAKLSVDAERPLANLRNGCDRASREACCGLADEYERGKWVPADATKASELRQKACALGEARCCHPQPPPSPQ